LNEPDSLASGGGPRRDTPVTRAVNARLSTLLADRLAALGLKRGKEFLALLNSCPESAEIFDTEKDTSRIRRINQWLSGERGVPRVVFELLETKEPKDPDLTAVFDLHRRLQDRDLGSLPITLALNLASRLDHGLDNPPPVPRLNPPKRKTTKNTAEIWRWATYLLNVAATKDKPGTILVDAAGFEAVSDQESVAGSDAREWRRALWRAIQAGWCVRHVLSWAPEAAQLPQSVQAELVVNLLYAAHEGGQYDPVIASPVRSANVIAAEGVGALTIWQQPSDAATKYGMFLDDVDLARFMTEGRGPSGLRFAVPTIALSHDPYSRLRFDMTLAGAELDAEAQHCMVKSGLPIALMPTDVARQQEEKWRGKLEDEAPYVHLHHEVRVRRREAFERLTKQPGTGRYRDILTVQGVTRYIETGDLGGGAFGGEHLDAEDRIKHARHVADALMTHPGYELALVDQRALLVPVDKNWWAAVRGVERDSRAVFFVSSRQQGREVENRQGWLSDSGSTNTVDPFFALFDVMWGTLPPETKDAKKVAAHLRALAR